MNTMTRRTIQAVGLLTSISLCLLVPCQRLHAVGTCTTVSSEISQGAADDHTVVILGTTVVGAPATPSDLCTSLEATQAAGQGFNVEIDNATAWGAKTGAHFATYREIILGDPNCASNTTPVAAAEANRTTWGPNITGNKVVVGTDPADHALYAPTLQPGASALTGNAIAFAAARTAPIQTGAYISLSCYYFTTPQNAPVAVPVLDQFGSFTAIGQSPSTGPTPGLPEDSHIVVSSHPVMTSPNALTDAALSGWHASTHEEFATFPSSFLVLAIQKDITATGYTASDGTMGAPYILATPAVITLPLNMGGGQNNYIFGPFNIKVHYPADSSFDNESLTVAAIPTTQAQLDAQTVEGPFSNAKIVPYDGAGGDGVTFVTTCQKTAFPNGPCDNFSNPTLPYEVFTSYDTPTGGSPPSNPAFLKKKDGAIYGVNPRPGDGNIFANFYIQRIDPTGAGDTCCGFSDYILVDLPPGPTTAATFNGFQTPLAPKNERIFTSGDTLAVKFTTTPTFPEFNQSSVVARISVEMTSTPQGTPAANFKSIPNNQFTFLKGTYQFYLDLTGYVPGNYLLIVTSNSFPTQQVSFTIIP